MIIKFPRIPINHPLNRAARQTNNNADLYGLNGAIEKAGLGTTVEQFAYLAQQRALRAVAAHAGYEMGHDLEGDEIVANEIIHSEIWNETQSMLIAAYMDGMLIGWVGKEMADEQPEQ